MAKYHIGKDGQPKPCRAAAGNCPLGEDSPHFSSKNSAQDYIEGELKKESYSFATVSKKSEEAEQEIADLPRDTYADSADDYLNNSLSEDFSVGVTREGPDYINQTLVNHGDDHYVVRTSGGEYTSFEVLTVDRVRPVRVPQHKAEANLVSTTRRHPEVNRLLKEVQEHDATITPSDKPWNDEEQRVFRSGNVLWAQSGRSKTIEREDGSKIHCFPLKTDGERNFTDTPYPVDVGVTLEENGERQNAREMDRGYAIYDDRSGKGVLMTYRAASEVGHESGGFKFDKGYLQPDEDSLGSSRFDRAGNIYTLEGKASGTATYYKRV